VDRRNVSPLQEQGRQMSDVWDTTGEPENAQAIISGNDNHNSTKIFINFSPEADV
jgi:hypothetical protein